MRQFVKLSFLYVLFFGLMGCQGSSGSSPEEPVVDPQPCDDCNWNIEQWKLTIPESRDNFYGSGGSSAAELIPATCSNNQTLTNDTDIAYFWTEENPRQMMFKVDLGIDGATTPNTSYVRSELRELYRYDTQSRCSSSNQNWEITGSHQLDSSLTIEQFPQISSIDPKVIVGQVHGKDIKQALVKVLWEGESKPVRVILNDSFVPNNGSCDTCQPFSVDLGTAKAYQAWQYQIKVDKTGILLSTTISGKTVTKSLEWGKKVTANDGKQYTLSTNWLNEEYYFKAGIYPQIATDSKYNGQIFEVGFDNIEVTHKP
ncbi:polysaccharide lyase family 7 protein [Shewanella holmiensis]|uniref:Polysaccharide lyase family 7 protein n=1 Tax=Shewanella holmiensis TaxID=2952222 RepID=A0A9X3AVU1_9GAMM|nr:polysaccharide lyase family 7 protein [Shewanella holmiensis]MCT7943010.1 polysaccharide lyase family 7 protein [Shewanella holmiensis]